jgi:hypothetical protein
MLRGPPCRAMSNPTRAIPTPAAATDLTALVTSRCRNVEDARARVMIVRALRTRFLVICHPNLHYLHNPH